MTARTVRAESVEPLRAIDLSDLTSIEARKRVCQLMRVGFGDNTVAALTGWAVTDIRRALAERARPS